MEHLSEVMRIIEAGLESDNKNILNYSNLLADKLEKEGEPEFANSIRRLLENTQNSISHEHKKSFMSTKSLLDKDSQLQLAEIKTYKKGEIFLALENNSQDYITEIITLINHHSELTKKYIKAYRSVILYGPPGTGKSQTAKFISAETGLPLVIVRIDGLISSYLGSTSKNIRTLFNFVKETPCILFLDEFDAIAKARDDINEIGELKRVVNSLLQNIDELEGAVPIIAATNHEQLLDSAVWRRFEYKVFVNLPTYTQRYCLLDHNLSDIITDKQLLSFLALATKSMSGSEIDMLSNYIKTYISMNNLKPTADLVFDRFIKFVNRTQHSADLQEFDKIHFLNKLRNSADAKEYRKLLTLKMISDLIGEAKSTVHDRLKKLNKKEVNDNA